MLAAPSERLKALELFYCYDEIVSSPENYPEEAVRRGQELGKQLKCR